MSACPLVTIAIPTYNRAQSYLPQALQCALQQTYSQFELIVSDNGSTDHTRALVTGLGDARIRYFRHDPNIGANNNFNFCLQQARGKYLSLLHDDDLIDPDFVESCIRADGASAEPGIIRTGTRVINAEGQTIYQISNMAVGLSTEAFFRAWFSARSPVYLCSTLFNTKHLRGIGGFYSKHNCYQDTMAVVELAARYGRVDVPEVKASFRLHPGEMALRRPIDQWCEDSIMLLKVMCDLVPEGKEDVLAEGLRFFSRANYSRASKANSPWERLVAILKVMKFFKYRQLPPGNFVLRVLYGTHLYNTLRLIKRHAVRPLRAVAR